MANYTVKKSVIHSISFWLVILSFLVIPLFIQIWRIIEAKNYSIEFLNNKIITRSGVLNKKEYQTVFMGVYSVSISQSFFGRIFNYGDVRVDCPGKWDVDTIGIKDPQGLKRFLESKISASQTTNVIHN